MAYEYTTASLVQAELQASTAFSSSTLPTLSDVTTWIQEESAYVNSLADTVFSTTAVSSEYIDYDGGDVLVLQYAPVTNFTTLHYNTNKLGSTLGSSWVQKTEDTDYTVYADLGMLHLLDSFSPKKGLKRLRAAYTYGYTTTPETVQMLVTKLVARRVIQTLLTKNINERNDGGSVSVGSISIVEPTNYGVGTYRQLNMDIEELKRRIVDGFKVKRSMFHLW